MLEIKFSHTYKKLYNNGGCAPESSILLEALPVNLEHLSKEFIDYDTDNGKYEFDSKGMYYLLIFKSVYFNHIFTTLRKVNDKTFNKYFKNVGKEFKVTIFEANP